MKLKTIFLIAITLSIISCDSEGPETGCHLNPKYSLDLHGIALNYIFNTLADKEVKNADLTTIFAFQYNQWKNRIPLIFPYNKFFIDKVSFLLDDSVRIEFMDGTLNTFFYTREDCHIAIESSDIPLALTLSDAGENIGESKFAIFEHDRTLTGKDTFKFIDFIVAPNIPIDVVLKNFAHDHPGTSDTMGLQWIFSAIRN